MAPTGTLRSIPLSYNSQSGNSRKLSLEIILAAFPEWEQSQDEIEIVKLTHGINNTVA